MNVSSTAENVIIKHEGRIATIMLNRPNVLNALDVPTIAELLRACQVVAASDVDVVILCGMGRGFSAGGDIKSMLTDMDESKFEPIMNQISELVVTLYTMPKLVIAAIHGPTAGLGLSLALAADYVIADASSLIAMNFIGIGLIPDGGGHFFLNQRVGEVVAKQLIWEGKRMTAPEAFKLGIIDEITQQDFQETVKKKAEEWLKKPVRAMLQTKNIFTELNKATLKLTLALEKAGQIQMRKTEDHAEGIQAFLEKRSPAFIGK